jgi:hypothetical protein
VSNDERCGVCDGETDAFLCRPCLHEVERAIGDCTSLLHEVSNVATRQTNVYRANGKAEDLSGERRQWDGEQKALPAMLRSREGRVALPATPMMVNLAARELLADAYDTLLTWASHLGADPISSTRVVAWLLTHANEIRFTEDAAQIHDEITYLHRRMVSAVDRSPSKVYAGPCHAGQADGSRCQRPLYGWPGADDITCDGTGTGSEYDVGCRTVHTTDQRQDWMLAELTDALLPLAVWQGALPRMLKDLTWPNRSTYWRWLRAKRLTPKTVAHGIELFRGGDVIDLVTEEQPRIIGNQGKPKRGRMSA